MKPSPEEKLAYDLIYMSKFKSTCISNYHRAIWVRTQFLTRYPTASAKAIYLWTIDTLNYAEVIPFPEKLQNLRESANYKTLV